MRAFAAILAGAAMLVWPAALNRYPLVFIDSVSYLGLTLLPEWPWDKTPAYGGFIHLLHGGWSLWPVIAAQGMIASHLVWLSQRALRGGAGAGVHLLVCGLLAAATAAPWVIATVMPDLFAALGPLALLLLGLARERLTRAETAWLVLLATLAIATHLSHLPTAVALLLLVAVATRRLRPVLRAGLPLALALLTLVAANGWAFGRPVLSAHGAVFLLARLQADGPAAETIRAHCPAAGWHLCAFADRLPMDSDEFLWDPAAPPNRQPDGTPIAMGGARLAPEAASIIRLTLLEHPLATARAMAGNTWRQLGMVAVGDTLRPDWLEASARRAIARLPPRELAAYDAGAQARGALPGLAAPFLVPLLPVLLVSLPLLAFALVRAARRREGQRAWFLAGLVLAVAVNAFATGALSKPHDRYQSRIVWLLPLSAMLGLLPRFGQHLNDAPKDRAALRA